MSGRVSGLGDAEDLVVGAAAVLLDGFGAGGARGEDADAETAVEGADPVAAACGFEAVLLVGGVGAVAGGQEGTGAGGGVVDGEASGAVGRMVPLDAVGLGAC
ncbi:hypothetical protein GCM10018966_062330 [Streptomyces yanii]